MIRIAIVDDHDLVREGIRAILEQDPSFEVVGETGDGQEAIRMANRLRPDVLLMDVHLPGGIGGLEATETIVADCPEVKVIILTQYENREYIRRAIRIGARGYLLKRSVAAQLKEAIKTVYAGQRYLHPAVADELVDLLTTGKSLEEDDYDRLTEIGYTQARLLGGFFAVRQVRCDAIYTGTLRRHTETVRGILDGGPAESLVAKEETFGPVAPVVAVDSLEQAIELANASPYGLLAAIFTRDVEKGLRFAESVRTGWVNVNESSNYWETHLPFGGRSGTASGIGRVGGTAPMEAFTELQTVVLS